MYTDLIYSQYVVVDLKTLILAYSYAGKTGKDKIALELRQMISECEEDSVRILKGTPLYQFLKSCPTIKEDQITLDMLGHALVITYYQKNRGPRKEIKNVIEKWEDYVKQGQETSGMEYEIVKLSEQTRQYILKYHNVEQYLEQKREQYKPVDILDSTLDMKQTKQKKIVYKDAS